MVTVNLDGESSILYSDNESYRNSVKREMREDASDTGETIELCDMFGIVLEVFEPKAVV